MPPVEHIALLYQDLLHEAGMDESGPLTALRSRIIAKLKGSADLPLATNTPARRQPHFESLPREIQELVLEYVGSEHWGVLVHVCRE